MKKSAHSVFDVKEIYSTFFDRSYEGLFIINEERKIVMANPSAASMLGYEKGELINEHVNKIVPENFQKECHTICSNFFSTELGEEKMRTKITFLKKDGSKLITESSLSNHIHSSNGKLMVVVFNDVTENYLLTKKLNEIKELHERAEEQMGNAFYSLDKNWRYIYINSVAIKYMLPLHGGRDMVGKVIWELFPELLGTEYERACREVMTARNSISIEVQSPYSGIWFEMYITPNNLGISIFSKDITLIKQKSDELKESEQLFSCAFYSSPMPYSISRATDRQIVKVNTSFLKLFGYKEEEVLGKTSMELNFYKNSKENKFEELARLMTLKECVHNFEITLNTKNDEPLDFMVSIETVEMKGQKHYLSTMLDITEKKKAENEMLLYKMKLENQVQERTLQLTQALVREKENNDLKSRFVSTASHEFRTPLTGLLTSVSILELYTKADTDATLSKHFRRIKLGVKNLTDILNDFLSLDKLENKLVNGESIQFNIKELAEECFEELKGVLKQDQSISFVQEGSVLITQDKKIIRNSLMNLLSNASKYSTVGQEIKVGIQAKNKNIKITVSDQGIGIPEKDKQHLFSLFFRAKNAESIQGTGLGLSIVKKYMELIGGTIHFDSVENQGSTFTLNFPFAD